MIVHESRLFLCKAAKLQIVSRVHYRLIVFLSSVMYSIGPSQKSYQIGDQLQQTAATNSPVE